MCFWFIGNKTETNDIKTGGFKPPDCVSTCSKVGPTYCCCGTCCTCDIDKTKCDKKCKTCCPTKNVINKYINMN